jgi:predicted dehydrogenase
MTSHYTRRDLMRWAASAGLASAFAAAAEKPVRIGMVGVGNRGTSLLRNFLDLPGVEVPAICDINEEHLARAVGLVEKAGQRSPEGYSRGVEDFRRLVERADLDAVVTGTPWEWHTPVCVAAMKAGKYAASEVPAAVTVEECWELVETSEKTRKPCMILENVCYFRNVLMVLNMIRQGVLGDLLHAEAGYQHDVRGAYFNRDTGDIKWRGMHALKRNGNLYPTHPIGPVAWWMDINRGDRFTYLTSMSSRSAGLKNYVVKRFGKDHPNAKRDYALGAVNTTLIRTEKGLTVTLYFDTQLPRAYDLILRVQGTEGIYSGTLEKVYVEDRSPKEHTWEDPEAYYAQYEHPIWKELGPVAKNYGHGGGDYIELHQFVRAVRNKTQTPIDVYDTATWSVISPLSEQSVAARSAPVDFPDFTRGKWRQKRSLDIAV